MVFEELNMKLNLQEFVPLLTLFTEQPREKHNFKHFLFNKEESYSPTGFFISFVIISSFFFFFSDFSETMTSLIPFVLPVLSPNVTKRFLRRFINSRAFWKNTIQTFFKRGIITPTLKQSILKMLDSIDPIVKDTLAKDFDDSSSAQSEDVICLILSTLLCIPFVFPLPT